MSADRRWISLLAQASPVREWDGEFLVFNPANASTHLITPPAYELLQALRDSPRALLADELAVQLLGAEAVDEGFLVELKACLQHFEDLGLAESLPA